MEKIINSTNLKALFHKSGDIVQRQLNVAHSGLIIHLWRWFDEYNDAR